MDLPSLIETIQACAPAVWMRTSVKAMPIVEAIHVLAGATVFGTILIVDLRLLGFPDARRSVTRVCQEMLRLTWGAFFVSLTAGLLMFAANAHTYYGNTAFRLKMLALLGAGVNMAIFHGTTFRSVRAWDRSVPVPLAGRLAGATSILLWVSVIFLARWIGFTKGYDFKIPANTHIDFQF
ncbi:MAG TPA: DUF6644 family protein [Steroidobacteraceae bacterium]|nr:DUF6644 family protein [Steroidobacteraceae bacterium]